MGCYNSFKNKPIKARHLPKAKYIKLDITDNLKIKKNKKEI